MTTLRVVLGDDEARVLLRTEDLVARPDLPDPLRSGDRAFRSVHVGLGEDGAEAVTFCAHELVEPLDQVVAGL